MTIREFKLLAPGDLVIIAGVKEAKVVTGAWNVTCRGLYCRAYDLGIRGSYYGTAHSCGGVNVWNLVSKVDEHDAT